MAKTIKEIALEVIDGKWGSGEARKKKLINAGYDYDKVQKKVNEILESQKTIQDKILDACKEQAEWMRNYHYEWQGSPTIEKSKKKGTCVTYVACVLQRVGLVKSGKYIWHENGKIYGDTQDFNISYISDKKISSLKSKLKKGDVLIGGNKKNNEAGGGSHIFIFAGKWSGERPYIYDNSSAERVKIGQSAIHTTTGNWNIFALLRVKSDKSKTYSGEYPSTRLVKSRDEVIVDVIRWAKWIAKKNEFHYGHGKDAHHNGCYFCGTQPKSKKNSGIKKWETTYCCNPFVGAAWAHGGCVPKAIELCSKGKSWDFNKGSGYDKSSLFDNLGHPAKSKLKAGDVLCNDYHVALYIGDGKIVEAGSEDDNIINSKKWINSIRIATLTDKRWDGFERAYRFNSNVDSDLIIRHGEVSDRIIDLKEYLNWYFGKKVLKVDRYYGESTYKYIKKFQEKELGKGQGDGLVGQKTIDAMKKVKK